MQNLRVHSSVAYRQNNVLISEVHVPDLGDGNVHKQGFRTEICYQGVLIWRCPDLGVRQYSKVNSSQYTQGPHRLNNQERVTSPGWSDPGLPSSWTTALPSDLYKYAGPYEELIDHDECWLFGCGSFAT